MPWYKKAPGTDVFLKGYGKIKENQVFEGDYPELEKRGVLILADPPALDPTPEPPEATTSVGVASMAAEPVEVEFEIVVDASVPDLPEIVVPETPREEPKGRRRRKKE